MRTRVFATLLLMLACGLAAAQPKVPRVGVLVNTVPLQSVLDGTTRHPGPVSLAEGLRKLGWVDGKTAQLVWRSAEGDFSKLPALARELVDAKVDVLVGYGPGAFELMRLTDQVPIVMATAISGRLVLDGVTKVESLARPGANVTGVTIGYGQGSDFIGKMLELVKLAAPAVKRVALLVEEPVKLGPRTLATGERMGVTLVAIDIGSRMEKLQAAFDEMARTGVEAALVMEMPVANLAPYQLQVHRHAERGRIVAVHAALSAVDSGGLMAYGADIDGLYRRIPYFIDRILRGAKPGDLPIEQPTELELRVNKNAARAIGITLPSSLLLQATKVIE